MYYLWNEINNNTNNHTISFTLNFKVYTVCKKKINLRNKNINLQEAFYLYSYMYQIVSFGTGLNIVSSDVLHSLHKIKEIKLGSLNLTCCFSLRFMEICN